MFCEFVGFEVANNYYFKEQRLDYMIASDEMRIK